MNDSKKILLLEPRRLAARRAAEFMAQQLNERVGNTVGFRIRNESQVGPTTAIEVLTEGILTRMLQRQPDLPEAGMIIFDEFHERSIHADLGLAFALDTQRHLRNDLKILIMSATLDGIRLSELLGQIPIIESRGKLFPIVTKHASFVSDKPIEMRTAETILRAIANEEGDLLVFLPGWREIKRVENLLLERAFPDNIDIRILHGDGTTTEQNLALAPAPASRRKIILSTNIAETSLTIEGVRVVIDSGLARAPTFDARRGMSGLVTIPISRASSDQRRGRAGRLASGSCYRLWTEAGHAQRQEFSTPEIKSADLLPLALELARWGAPNGENLTFLDPPPAANLKQAQTVLKELECVDERGRLTASGRAIAELPVHPRFGHMILRAKTSGYGSTACVLAALLDERDVFTGTSDADIDIASRWHALFSARTAASERVFAQARRLQNIAGIKQEINDKIDSFGLLIAWAYPERIAKRRQNNLNTYLMASGDSATLPQKSLLSREEFLAVAEAETTGSTTKICLASPISKSDILEHFGYEVTLEDDVRWDTIEQSVIARQVQKLGAIILSERPLPGDDPRIVRAMAEGICEIGLHILPWNKESLSLRQRSEWLRNQKLIAGDWPNLSDEGILRAVKTEFLPFLNGIRRSAQLSKLDMTMMLQALFKYEQLHELDTMAPSHISLPSGSHVALSYETDFPTLAVRLQELFGQLDTPRIGAGKIPVTIHLLSPAKRPLAVTQDLKSFWQNVYPEIRRQMRAKYPKHIWPDDPINTKPTSKTKRQLHKQL
jgi:ATP-dependent helicase HrpB